MNINVSSISKRFSTRESGAAARLTVLHKLSSTRGAITLNFAGIEPTPSFADEFVGRLAEELGEANFRGRIRFENLAQSTRLLLQTVVTKRLRTATSRTGRKSA
jgi:hypothetical protein